MPMRTLVMTIMLFLVSAALAWFIWAPPRPWTAAELITLQSLALEQLQAEPKDSTNRVFSNPEAQKFGYQLFFDTRLSRNGAIACASCHQPGARFADNLPLSVAIGTTKRNTPSIVGVAYSPWFYWDGRKDSLWSQALAPLEDPGEHGGNRLQYVHLIAEDPTYRNTYEAIFGPFPSLKGFPRHAGPVANPKWRAAWQAMTPEQRHTVNRVFSNIGKAIAAYEGLLVPGESRFDKYVKTLVDYDERAANEILDTAERRGLKLFIGQGNCTQCHNGPLFSNNAFHNTGLLSRPMTLPDIGRAAGLRVVLADPFNCLGAYSDDPVKCDELRFANTGPELVGSMRTASLRNVIGTAPYSHSGQQTDLRAVLEQYNQAPDAMIGHNESKPLDLWPWQISDLEAFLKTLNAPIAAAPEWLRPPGGG